MKRLSFIRRLSLFWVFVGAVGFITHYVGSSLAFHGPDWTPSQIQVASTECALLYGLPLNQNVTPEAVPIEALSTKERNALLGCALESGSYNFVRWTLQNPKEMLSIESKFNGHWPVESVARWANGPAAVDTLKLILEPNAALWTVNSTVSLMVALYEVSTVDAAEYLAENFYYLLAEDNQRFFASEDYPKYLGLTLAQYHAFSGRIDVAEYFAGKGSRVAIPGKNLRQWILAYDKKKLLNDKVDAFLSKHGVPRENSDEIAAAPVQPALSLPTSALIFPSTTGWPLPLGDSGRVLWIEDNTGRRWDPATNELKDNFKLPFLPESAVETTQGIVFVSNGRVAAVTPGGETYNARLTQRRSKQVVLLADQSVLVLDGSVTVDDKGHAVRSNMVERIVFQPDVILGDPLRVERMPDLPGKVRTAFSTVALTDGRAMVLGGNDSRYVGCMSCTAETWFLNPKGKSWSAGPKMNEARSDMSATPLPDGGVLVAGGWTPEHGWGGAGSRTVERWDPHKNAFVPMAVGMTSYMSMHRALWLPGLEGKQLLLAGGNSAAIQVYDVVNNIWRVAGENCHGTANNGLRTVIPFFKDKQYFVIVKNDFKCPGQDASWGLLVPLRLPLDAGDIKSTARNFTGDSGVTLYRRGIAFLPGQNEGPSLALGGSIDAGGDKYIITSAADALWPDGHIQSLPGFVHARSDARLFRLTEGALLLVGGQTDVGGYDHAHEKASSAEWLLGHSALEQGRWQPFELFGAHDVMGQMVDGSLIALDKNGEVSLIKINTDAQGKPHAEASQLPPLSRPRLPYGTDGIGLSLVVRGLPDGRIIVAGGATQNKRLAIMHENSMDPNAEDDYLWIGEAEPSNDYEIYEPATGQWRLSAASRADGGRLAVYDDGRVARLSANPKKSDESDESRPVNDDPLIEISSADGRSWSELRSDELPIIRVGYDTRMFVLQDELFIAGMKLHARIETLQWFNGATRRWETLWHADREMNWRNDIGRIIIRRLSNGKRVMLPVAGL